MADRFIVDITSGSILRFLFIVIVLWFLFTIRDILAFVFLSIVIASAVSPSATWLQNKGVPRALGVLLIYLLALLVIGGVLSIIIPVFTAEIRQLARILPSLFQQLSMSFEGSPEIVQRYPFLENIQTFLSVSAERLEAVGSNLFNATVSVFGGIFWALVVIVISIYLSVMEDGVKPLLRAFVPAEHQGYILDLWRRAQDKMGSWLKGQLFLALAVGILVYAGLSVLGVKYALVLAILAGILEIIPFVGPILAAIPAFILAFFQAPILALWVLALYILIQELENHLLAPKVMERVVGLNPVIVIIAVLIGGKLGGILGMIISIPLAAIIAEFVRDFTAPAEPVSEVVFSKTSSIKPH